jgi:mRNA interferase YafQ
MSRELFYTNQFKKDFKHAQKQGKNLAILKQALTTLAKNENLDVTFKDHPLRGNYAGTRECHLGPDWLLIYRINRNEIHLLRTGSHSELFNL